MAAARFLARELVEAWHAEGTSAHLSPRELETRALREVVAQCLYGADINDMAVEMCKLSLWLVSLDRDLPFSFVDDKVLLGNSLLGVTNLSQIESLHIAPESKDSESSLFLLDAAMRSAERVDLSAVMQRVRRRRLRLATEVSETDPGRTAAAKRRLMDEINHDLVQVKKLADGVIAAGLRLGGKPGKKLNEAYETLEIAASRAFPNDGTPDSSLLDSIIADGLTPTVETDYDRWQPLHWALAVPDVMERGGFDAIIGNPPFLGGQKLTGAMGTDVRDWFVNVLAEGRRGSADLVAYFFLRAVELLNSKGSIGLIATNTVAQGDTREVGLDAMVARGFTITRAIQSRSWPASSANLEYAAVWGTLAPVEADAPRIADDQAVRRISTLLEPAGRVEGNPVRLPENEGIAFQGCIVLGMGFVITPEEAQEWIAADARNAEVLFPYLNGEDLNSTPDSSATRWVIDFGNRSEAEAATYQLPYGRLRETVMLERAKGSKAVREVPWWLFLRARPAMRRAIADLSEVLVIALVSKTIMPLRVSTSQTFSNTLGVFATDDYCDQAVLSSSLHQLWAITYGSGMRNDPRYTPSDVFETFPRPKYTAHLSDLGKILELERREIMLRRQIGVTKLYSLVNDPGLDNHADTDVARIRCIHNEIDRAVASAYGWDDLELKHQFETHRQMTRWTITAATRIELLDRLLEENQRRSIGA